MSIIRQEADKYQDLFNFLNKEHDLILTISEMNDIISEVEKFQQLRICAVICLSLITISEPTRQAEISYAVFCW